MQQQMLKPFAVKFVQCTNQSQWFCLTSARLVNKHCKNGWCPRWKAVGERAHVSRRKVLCMTGLSTCRECTTVRNGDNVDGSHGHLHPDMDLRLDASDLGLSVICFALGSQSSLLQGALECLQYASWQPCPGARMPVTKGDKQDRFKWLTVVWQDRQSADPNSVPTITEMLHAVCAKTNTLGDYSRVKAIYSNSPVLLFHCQNHHPLLRLLLHKVRDPNLFGI